MKGFQMQEIQLPQQKQYSMEHYNGRNYNTIIWRQYVLFPQQTGKLEIPAVTFDGVVAQQTISDDPFDAFFNGGGYIEVKKKKLWLRKWSSTLNLFLLSQRTFQEE